MNSRSFLYQINLAFTIATALLLVVSIVSYRSTLTLLELMEERKASSRLAKSYEEVVSALKDAETSERGFVLTGREETLAPFSTAKLNVPTELRKIFASPALTAEMNHDSQRLARLIEEKFAEIEQVVHLRRSAGFEAAVQAIQVGPGELLMVQIRDLTTLLEEKGEEAFRTRDEIVQNSRARTLGMIGGSSALAILLVAGAAAAVNRDTVRRQRIEDELRLSESRFRCLTDSNLIGVATCDDQGVIDYANDRFLQVIGSDRTELDGGNCSWSQQVDGGQESPMARVARAEPEEIQYSRKDGRKVWLLAGAAKLEKSGAYILFVHDITARKEAAAALQRERQAALDSAAEARIARDEAETARRLVSAKAEELERSNKDLEQFAYVASHDLQEPLRAVAGCTQILRNRYREQLDEKALELIGHAVDGAERMQRLIADLLAYSRVGTRGGQMRNCSMEEVMERALVNLRATIEESGAQVTYEPLPQVFGDPVQLTQVLQNIVGNGLKYRGEAPPRIHVSAMLQEDHWRLSVRDNGIGIAPEYFERIFGIFQRLHTRREYSGTGIGLAICQKIILRHGGRIWVESAPGGGSTFHFTIPAENSRHSS